jgi:hypothetical protein
MGCDHGYVKELGFLDASGPRMRIFSTNPSVSRLFCDMEFECYSMEGWIHLLHGKGQASLDVSGDRKINDSGRLNVQNTYLAPLAIPGRGAIFEFDRQGAGLCRREAKSLIV